jgi:hypothetical protein
LLLLPIIIRVVIPRQSTAALEGAGTWLERHNRVIVIAVSVVFGIFFLVRGITGLVA